MMRKIIPFLRANSAMILLLAVALSLRVLGNGFGLPDEFHIDEVHFVPRAIRFGAGDLNPHWFYYPPLYMYLLFILYAAYFVIGHFTGIFPSAADFGMQYFLDPSAFYIIGRTLTAVIGTATVWLTFSLGRRAYSRGAGMAAATMLALCFLHVEHSHYITGDVPMTFAVTLALFFALRHAESGRARDMLLSGLIIGLGMAVKYTAIIAAPACGLAALLRFAGIGGTSSASPSPDEKSSSAKGKFVPLLIAGTLLAGGIAAGFIAGCPWIILDPTPVLGDIRATAENIQGTWLGQEEVKNMWVYVFTDFLRPGMSLPLLILCLAGLVFAFVRRRAADIILAIYIIVFYLWVAHYPHYGYARYWTAVLPPLCLLGGRLLEEIAAALPALKTRAAEAAFVIALIIVSATGLQSYRFIKQLMLLNTRTIARHWVEQNVPAHTRIAVEMNGPSLKSDEQSIIDSTDPARREKYNAATVEETMKFDILNRRSRPWAEKSVTNKKYQFAALKKTHHKYYLTGGFSLAALPLDFYREEKYQYLIVNSGMYKRYYAAADRFPRTVAFYRRLERECAPPPGGDICELAARIEPHPGKTTGETILIYRLKQPGETSFRQ